MPNVNFLSNGLTYVYVRMCLYFCEPRWVKIQYATEYYTMSGMLAHVYNSPLFQDNAQLVYWVDHYIMCSSGYTYCRTFWLYGFQATVIDLYHLV